jgi:hypothetical protein
VKIKKIWKNPSLAWLTNEMARVMTVSLASGGETTAFSSFTMSQETTVPPCHQTMENSDMEISLDDDEDHETKTIIMSEASSQNMRFIK